MLNEIDQRIVHELKINARQTVRQLAKKIGVSHATAQRHLKKLFATKALQIVAIPNPMIMGYQIWLMLGIKVRPGWTLQVAEALLKYKELYFICECFGSYDIMVTSHFESFMQMVEFINEKLSKIDGIESIDTMYRTRLLRYFNHEIHRDLPHVRFNQ